MNACSVASGLCTSLAPSAFSRRSISWRLLRSRASKSKSRTVPVSASLTCITQSSDGGR